MAELFLDCSPRKSRLYPTQLCWAQPVAGSYVHDYAVLSFEALQTPTSPPGSAAPTRCSAFISLLVWLGVVQRDLPSIS